MNLDLFYYNYISVCLVYGKRKIVPEQSGLNRKDKDIIKFCFLKSKLIHMHQCYLYYCSKILHKKLFGTQNTS